MLYYIRSSPPPMNGTISVFFYESGLRYDYELRNVIISSLRTWIPSSEKINLVLSPSNASPVPIVLKETLQTMFPSSGDVAKPIK